MDLKVRHGDNSVNKFTQIKIYDSQRWCNFNTNVIKVINKPGPVLIRILVLLYSYITNPVFSDDSEGSEPMTPRTKEIIIAAN